MGRAKAREEDSLHEHTVDGDGNDLGEVEAVGTLEGRDLAEGLELQVLSGGGSGRPGLGVDQLEVELIVLGSDQHRDGAGVLLKERLEMDAGDEDDLIFDSRAHTA